MYDTLSSLDIKFPQEYSSIDLVNSVGEVDLIYQRDVPLLNKELVLTGPNILKIYKDAKELSIMENVRIDKILNSVLINEVLSGDRRVTTLENYIMNINNN